MKREYKLPDGKITISPKRYSSAYRKLAKPICRVFKDESKYGYAYDPGLQLGTFSLSNSQAIKLYELITKKKYKC